MIDKNWARWIFASLSVHFENGRGTVPMYVEGQDRNTASLNEYIELRIDGPYYKELSKTYYQLDLECNVLCCAKRDNIDNHKIHRITGLISSLFKTDISVFKYGDGPDDNPTIFVGCLIRRDEKREEIVTSHFGQIDPDIPVLQATVEAHYRMHLHGSN